MKFFGFFNLFLGLFFYFLAYKHVVPVGAAWLVSLALAGLFLASNEKMNRRVAVGIPLGVLIMLIWEHHSFTAVAITAYFAEKDINNFSGMVFAITFLAMITSFLYSKTEYKKVDLSHKATATFATAFNMLPLVALI